VQQSSMPAALGQRQARQVAAARGFADRGYLGPAGLGRPRHQRLG
jgi:hypothetical protein